METGLRPLQLSKTKPVVSTDLKQKSTMKSTFTNLQRLTASGIRKPFANRRVALACLLLPLLACVRSANAHLSNGLVAHYPFDGSANDASGNNNNPIIGGVHNVSWTTNRFGQANLAAAFNGTAWIDYGNNPALGFSNTSFTVSFWIKATVQDSYIIGKNDTALGRAWGIQCENTPVDGLGVRLDLGDGTNFTPNAITTGPGVFGGWRHVCMVVDRALQTATTYLDGVPTSSVGISQIGSIANSVSVMIGNRGDGWPMLTGQLDEIRIYNRAVSSAEAAELFGGLAAYYPFDGNANDASGNSNNPVAINGVTYTTDRFGIPSAAALFNGARDINYGTNALPETGKGSFSVSFWIYANTQDGYVIGTKNGGGDPGPYWAIQCENTAQASLGVRLDLSDGTHYTPGDATAVATGGGVFGNWHHVCMVIDRLQQKASAYLDGSKQSAFDISLFGSVKGTNSLRMGWRGDWLKLNGLLDEVFIYNRALSAVEIMDLASEPRLNLAFSQVRLCWNSRINKKYQVQYRSTLTTNTWVNLGSPLPGIEGTQCITDEIASPQKFYRTVMVP